LSNTVQGFFCRLRRIDEVPLSLKQLLELAIPPMIGRGCKQMKRASVFEANVGAEREPNPARSPLRFGT
jgi:hypothetical protein